MDRHQLHAVGDFFITLVNMLQIQIEGVIRRSLIKQKLNDTKTKSSRKKKNDKDCKKSSTKVQ